MKRLYGAFDSVSINVLYALVILFKVWLTVFTINQVYESDVPESFALCTGDCPSYLEPIENLVNNHHYLPDFRMPGYGVFYLPLYYFFAKPLALNLLVVLQTILDIIASILLIKTVWLLTSKKTGVLIAFILYGIGCTITTYNKITQAESATASLILISFYFLVQFNHSKKSFQLFLSSVFIVWAYFCRPVCFPLFLLLLFYIAYNSYKEHKLKYLLVFLFPFLLLQSTWTIRNYIIHNKLFLLTETAYYPTYLSSEIAAYNFQQTFGDFKTGYFFPDSKWKNRASEVIDINTVEFPNNIYTDDFNKDSLLELRKYAALIYSNADSITPYHKSQYNQLFTEKANRYASSIKANHKYLVYIKVPVQRIFNHVFKSSGVQYLYIKSFSDLTVAGKAFKLFFILLFLAALYGAVLFIIKTIYNYGNIINILIALSCLYGLLIHPTLLGTADPRYLYVFYPLIALSASLFYSSLNLNIFTKKVNG